MTDCKVCGAPAAGFATAYIRAKHHAEFARCTACGFVFVDRPSWLAEAYVEPINRSDTGYVSRNLWCRSQVCSLLENSPALDPAGTFLDYAAGFGLFVRLMRDSGYDFRWFDLYCQNLFSRGFEAPIPLSGHFEAITAFEVFEHLPEPSLELEKIAKLTSTIIFSTLLLPEPVPQPGEWWYYGLEHGQHVAFYTRESLQCLARRIGCDFLTNGHSIHVFTRKPVRLECPPRGVLSQVLRRARRRLSPPRRLHSLTQPDHEFIVARLRGDQATAEESGR